MLMAPPADVVFQHMRDEEPPGDLVTVAVSLYNYAQFLSECLDSVLAQRHAAIELVVVDNVSTADNSLAVASAWLQEHAQQFSRVLLLRHRRNKGLARARNTAFAHARASHVFVMDADNTIYPRAIGRLRQAIETSRAAAAYTQMELLGPKKRSRPRGHLAAEMAAARQLHRCHGLDLAQCLAGRRRLHPHRGRLGRLRPLVQIHRAGVQLPPWFRRCYTGTASTAARCSAPKQHSLTMQCSSR